MDVKDFADQVSRDLRNIAQHRETNPEVRKARLDALAKEIDGWKDQIDADTKAAVEAELARPDAPPVSQPSAVPEPKE